MRTEHPLTFSRLQSKKSQDVRNSAVVTTSDKKNLQHPVYVFSTTLSVLKTASKGQQDWQSQRPLEWAESVDKCKYKSQCEFKAWLTQALQF